MTKTITPQQFLAGDYKEKEQELLKDQSENPLTEQDKADISMLWPKKGN